MVNAVISAKQVHHFALQRRQDKVTTSISREQWQQVEALLRMEWSPEEIGARLRMEGSRFISHEWIYQYVYADKAKGGDLHTFLRCQKQRKKLYDSTNRRGKIPHRVGIEQRPTIVDIKTRWRLGSRYYYWQTASRSYRFTR